MAYEINKTNGNLLTSVPDGEIDVTTSIRLVGKNFPGYGEIMAENLVNMLENFSNVTPPANPLAGQLWYNTQEDQLYFYDINNVWRVVESHYRGTQVKSLIIKDTADIQHYILAHYANSKLVMLISSDSTFTPKTDAVNTAASITLTSFPTIGPGINMSAEPRTDGDAYKVRGVAVAAQFS
jgi:hypothetical protein